MNVTILIIWGTREVILNRGYWKHSCVYPVWRNTPYIEPLWEPEAAFVSTGHCITPCHKTSLDARTSPGQTLAGDEPPQLCHIASAVSLQAPEWVLMASRHPTQFWTQKYMLYKVQMCTRCFAAPRTCDWEEQHTWGMQTWLLLLTATTTAAHCPEIAILRQSSSK